MRALSQVVRYLCPKSLKYPSRPLTRLVPCHEGPRAPLRVGDMRAGGGPLEPQINPHVPLGVAEISVCAAVDGSDVRPRETVNPETGFLPALRMVVRFGKRHRM